MLAQERATARACKLDLGHQQHALQLVSDTSWYLTGSPLLLLTAADSFKHKEFFAKVGLASKSADDIKKAFAVIDQDHSGFIEEEELK